MRVGLRFDRAWGAAITGTGRGWGLTRHRGLPSPVRMEDRIQFNVEQFSLPGLQLAILGKGVHLPANVTASLPIPHVPINPAVDADPYAL